MSQQHILIAVSLPFAPDLRHNRIGGDYATASRLWQGWVGFGTGGVGEACFLSVQA